MAYNGYNQYSPYWQQTAGQTTPQSASQSVGQSRNSYQPLSAYQNNQRPAQPSTSQSAENSSGTSYDSQGYGNVAVSGAGNGRSRDFRTAYTNNNDRASLDGATALGNLAYASSLGRDGSAVDNYNRQQGSTNYSTASPYGLNPAPPLQNRTGNERRESSASSRDDTTARAQQATASPSFGYSSNSAAYQAASVGGNIQNQTQYQQSRSASEQHRLSQFSQPPRPTSGQAIQQPHSRLDSQPAPAPTIPTTQSSANQSLGRKDSGNGRAKTQTRVQTPQQSTNYPSSSRAPGPSVGHTQRSQTQQCTRESGTEQSAISAMTSKAGARLSSEGTTTKRISDARQSPTVDAKRQSSNPATPVEPQYTTVDPSQVFNHVEYSRRQAAAAAEAAAARKAVEDAEAARVAAMQPKMPQVNGTSAAASAPGSESDLAKKDQMELEMKQMIEKMRDYKAKDPSLFTQIWEQVKKGQPLQRAPSQSLQGSATSPIVANGQLPSPSLLQSQLPPESDLPAGDEFPPDFDRGRFPAQRRRRGGGLKTSTGRKSGVSNDSTKPLPQGQTAESQSSPLPPEIAIPTPKVGQIFPDPGSQSMQQAMQQFHQNSKSPVNKAQQKPASNKHAKTNTSTPPQKAPPSMAPPSQAVAGQSAPPPKPGGTYWPESKKKALAEAARIALNSTAPNQGKEITTQEIHELLDMNPSYTQMCEILEYRGFVIDRGQFARVLLKAVPDLGSASNPANDASTNNTSTDRATPTHATPTVAAPTATTTTKAGSATPTGGSLGTLVKATSNVSAAPTTLSHPLPYSAPPGKMFQAPNAYVTPYAYAPPSTEQASGGNQSNGPPRDYRFVDPSVWTPDRPLHATTTNQGQHQMASHSHPPFSAYQQSGSQVIDQSGTIHLDGVLPQPTKQEMARKRSFGEIVDLTTLSDDEDFRRHRPIPRVDDKSASRPSNVISNAFDQAASRQQYSDKSTPKPFKYKYSGRDALLQSYDIVVPMNKRGDALRRSTYNSKTIARDILLAIGRHPTMTPLNAHLDVLKDRFKAVDNESDLSTFRWDLVDPEGEATARSFDTDDEDATANANAEPRQRQAPTAVMVNADRGDNSRDEQVKPSKRGPYKKPAIRSGIQPLGSTVTSERQPLQSSPYAEELSKMLGTKSTDLSRFAYNSPYTAQTELTTPKTPNLSTPETALKRKGRPPGAKNKQVRPDKGVPKKTKTPSTDPKPLLTTAPLDTGPVGRTPSVGSSPIGKPIARIPTRPLIDTTTPSRPSGLRNSISAVTPVDGIAVVIPSRSPSVSVVVTPQASAKKIRPRMVEDRSNATPSRAPAYTMYRCHWENCPAELHNLETLKKHVKKHRRAVDGVYPCLWADCSDSSNPISNNTQSEDGQYKRSKFKTDAEWLTHVESNHLRTERERLPGGPGSGSVEVKIDSNGSQTS